jgi:spore maturation protein A
MAGILAFWNGLMEIAKESGLVSFITGLLEPIISFLFPDIPKNHPVREHLSTNMAANILGLGMAATPAGLKAMKELAKLNHKKSASPELASTEMCNFLILNISSLQLIPVNIIAYRSQYGSSYPSAIVGPGILATALSTAAGILFCKIAARFSHSPKS